MGKSRKKGGPPPRVKAKSAPRPQPSAAASKKAVPPAPAPGEEKTVLHIGWCSALPERLHAAFRQPGWKVIRMDVNAALNPDIAGVFTDIKPVQSASIDAVWCPHLLHRFFLHDVLTGLRECFRVLKEGGRLITSVPDAQLAATYLANNKPFETVYDSPAGPVTAIDMLYGFVPALREGKTFLAHRTGFTAESLGLAMRETGFTNIQVQRDVAEITALGFKYRYDHPDRVERLALGKATRVPVNAPVAPAATAPAPAAAPAKGANTATADWLYQAPAAWKPLGLNKPS